LVVKQANITVDWSCYWHGDCVKLPIKTFICLWLI